MRHASSQVLWPEIQKGEKGDSDLHRHSKVYATISLSRVPLDTSMRHRIGGRCAVHVRGTGTACN